MTPITVDQTREIEAKHGLLGAVEYGRGHFLHNLRLLLTDFAEQVRQQVIADLAQRSGAMPTPVAKVLLREDEDGLEPVMFYGGDSAPDQNEFKDKFKLVDVHTSQQVHESIASLQAKLEQSEARVSELERDAARYRWLRLSVVQQSVIDAAMKKEPEA